MNNCNNDNHKNTNIDGGSTAAYTVFTINTVYYSNCFTLLKQQPVCMPIYNVTEGQNTIGLGSWASEQNVRVDRMDDWIEPLDCYDYFTCGANDSDKI